MGETTNIAWCDATFNPWWGCQEISPACDNCYAEAWAKRVGFDDIWGIDSKRRTFGDDHWTQPLRWNRKANAEGKRKRVFCASMADVFDNHPDVVLLRAKLWEFIAMTPMLDWLILTKRIGNAKTMLPDDWGDYGYPNVWLGISVVTQAEVDRDVPKLLATPATIRFLSMEPLIERVRFSYPVGVDWVICGGESGRNARPMDVDWATSLRHQCEERDIAFFMKQGSQANWPDFKNFESFPKSLKVRQWPA